MKPLKTQPDRPMTHSQTRLCPLIYVRRQAAFIIAAYRAVRLQQAGQAILG